MCADIFRTPSCQFLVSIHPDVVERDEILLYLANQLIEAGCVHPSYAQAVLEREREFPTGVKLDGQINIALAHAAPEHVYQNGIIIGVLAQPINFRQINIPLHSIPVNIVFMLAAVSYNAINYYIEKLVEEVLMKPDVIAWLAGIEDKESIHRFFDQKVFTLEIE